MDSLSPEDQLRLEILLTQDLKGVRIDEGRMILHALTSDGECSLPLHPNDRPERYLKRVREVLAGHALGSPGGYPVYLSRWTRHGQIEGENLGRLLLTGEPEAVIAVVYSPSLDDDIARYAWWAMPTLENASLMLRNSRVAVGGMGRVLSDFLAEHLPFLQEDHVAIMNAVAVLLAAGRLDAGQELVLWKRARRQPCYAVPFIEQRADRLPGTENKPPAQVFAGACLDILEKPETQEVVNRVLNAIGIFFGTQQRVVDGTLVPLSPALERLAEVSDALTGPIFARSTAIGSLMRRKIAPVIDPLREDLHRVAQGG